MRGGVSDCIAEPIIRDMSSPCAWGCFFPVIASRAEYQVFPMCVGVFLALCSFIQPTSMSSPCAWGCFQRPTQEGGNVFVFPMCVGVFPFVSPAIPFYLCLPHVRGGVSDYIYSVNDDEVSSPCAWGCFLTGKDGGPISYVFPMCVGVFPQCMACWMRCGCLPHVRGGVSQPSDVMQNPAQSSPCAWGCFCRCSD